MTPPMADEPMVTAPIVTGPAGANPAGTAPVDADHPDAPAPHDPADDHAAAAPKRDPLPVLFGIGVLILIGAVVFLWRHPINLASFSSQPAASPTSATVAANTPSATTPAAPATAPPAVPSSVPGEPSAADKPAAPPATAEQTPPPPAPPPAADKPPDSDAASSPPSPATVAAAEPPPAVPTPAAPPASALPAASQPAPPQQTSGNDALAGQIGELQHRLDGLDQQVKQLGQAPPPPDLGPLDKRLTALENRPAPTDPSPAIAALGAKLDAVSAKLDALGTAQTQLAAKQGSDSAALAARLEADEGKIDVVGKQASGLASLSDRAARIARIQAAAAALTAGQALGDIPGATPPLEKFRAAPPPTEASLRLSFPAAAKAAENAAQPDTGRMPFWQAVQNRAEQLVTVRRGDQVIVGDSTAGVIARARVALDAGDLAGAVAAIGSLTGPPAQAMAEWTAQARALLDARAALAALAARA